jgi:hypothetical protein
MKFKHFALLALFVATISLFTSCKKDEEPTEKEPTINFVGGTGFTSTDVTLPAGSVFKVGITAAANTNSNAKLVKFKVTRTANNVPTTVTDSTLSTATLNFTRSYTTNMEGSKERWTFEVTDSDGMSKAVTFEITSEAIVKIYTAILMGGQMNTTVGSFWSSASNTVMKQADAIVNQAKVDFLYFYGTTNLATIAAVDDDQAAIAWNNLFDNWTVKNATRFNKVTGVNWDNVTEYNEELILQYATSLTASKANLLAVGDIVAFQTAATSTNPGKKGLFKVTAITGTSGTDRTITLEVKIQK